MNVMRLSRVEPGSCGGDKYALLFPEEMFKRAFYHMGHLKAGFSFNNWRSATALLKLASGVLKRMGSLQLSRAWEKWQVRSIQRS